MPTTYTNRSVTYMIMFAEGGPEETIMVTYTLGHPSMNASLADIDSAMSAFVNDLHANEPIDNVTRSFNAHGSDGDPWMTPT